jgi:peptide/nickel transport system ATP-binding protein
MSGAASAAPLLTVEGLTIRFGRGADRLAAVEDLSFSIAPGEILALVGESGSGKSATARALLGLSDPAAQVEAARLTLSRRDGTLADLTRLSPRAWQRLRGREIGFVLQDALASLDPLRRVGQEVAEPIQLHRLLPLSRIPAAVTALLGRAGIPDAARRATQFPHELSGGLRQRALIASALAAEPRLLIADEPTTALDVTIQQQILDVFARLAEAGHTILLITHDLVVASRLAHRVAVMQHGRIVETGPAAQVLAQPRHPYTRALRAAVPRPDNLGRLLSRQAEMAPARPAPTPQAPRLLSVEEVTLDFHKAGQAPFRALDKVSLMLRRGETLGLVGESGSGKTTLGRVALALQRPATGRVLLDGAAWSSLAEAERRPRRKLIQTIVQDPLASFNPGTTVGDLIARPLLLWGLGDAVWRDARLRTLLDQVNLPVSLSARDPRSLSGGQRQRVAIAQALAAEPALLICDEPVSALDVTTQAQVLDLLVGLQAELGLALLFISHDLGVVRHLSHRIAVMQRGRIVEEGVTDDIFSQPRHPYTQTLLDSLPALPATPDG